MLLLNTRRIFLDSFAVRDYGKRGRRLGFQVRDLQVAFRFTAPNFAASTTQ